jgi:hypothetical protein
MLNDSFDVSLQQALDAEGRNQSISLAVEDAREARDAFPGKREPVFRRALSIPARRVGTKCCYAPEVERWAAC